MVGGPAGQPGEDVRSRAVGVSSGVIAHALILDLRCLEITALETITKFASAQQIVV